MHLLHLEYPANLENLVVQLDRLDLVVQLVLPHQLVLLVLLTLVYLVYLVVQQVP